MADHASSKPGASAPVTKAVTPAPGPASAAKPPAETSPAVVESSSKSAAPTAPAKAPTSERAPVKTPAVKKAAPARQSRKTAAPSGSMRKLVETAIDAPRAGVAAIPAPASKAVAGRAAKTGTAIARRAAAATDAAVAETAKLVEATVEATTRTATVLREVVGKRTGRKSEAVAARAMPLRKLQAPAPGRPALFEQTLLVARLVGEMQARFLDHACNELRANLKAAETIARAGSASEVFELQTAAMRRGYDANAAHFASLASVAEAALKR